MSKEERKINPLYGNFTLVGTIVKPKEDKKYYEGNKVSDSGFKYSKVSFSVKTGESNYVQLSTMGGFSIKKANEIRCKDKDNKNELKIAWADRHDKKILANVADYRKLKLNLNSSDENECQEFLSEYDFVEAIAPNLQKDTKVFVYGKVQFEKYKKDNEEKISMKFIPTKIRLAKEDETPKASMKISFVFNKDSLQVEEEKTLVNAYVTTWNKEAKENEFVMQPFVIDVNYLAEVSNKNGKPTNDKWKETITKLYTKYFTADFGEYFETEWTADIINGFQSQEITEGDLNDDQKMLIELGLSTFEQIKNQMRTRTGGPSLTEVRLVAPTSKFQDEKGTRSVNLLTGYTEEDFYAKSPQVESKEELFNKQVETLGATDETEDLLKGLFD